MLSWMIPIIGRPISYVCRLLRYSVATVVKRSVARRGLSVHKLVKLKYPHSVRPASDTIDCKEEIERYCVCYYANCFASRTYIYLKLKANIRLVGVHI